MRRNFIMIFILIGAVSLIAGSIIYYAAGLNDNEQVKLSGKATIVTDSQNYEAVAKAAENFKKVHPRVEIEVIKENSTYARIGDEISKGRIQEDIIVIPEQDTEPLLEKSSALFLDMTQDISSMNETFSKSKLEVLTYNKKIYGIPWLSKPMLVLYRSDIFSAAGVDIESIKTWEDFYKAGKELSTGIDKKFLVYNVSQFDKLKETMLSQLRIGYTDKENHTRVNDLLNGMISDKTLQAVNSVVVSAKNETALAIIADPYDAVKIMNSAPALKGKWGAMKLPAFEPGGNRDVSLGGCNLLINKNTKNALLAKEFAKYLTTDLETVVNNLKDYGNFSAAYSIYDNDAFSFSAEYFNMDIWVLFADVEKNAPRNIY